MALEQAMLPALISLTPGFNRVASAAMFFLNRFNVMALG